MGLIVDFREGWDSQTRIDVEDAIRKCIAEPPEDEQWIVSLAASFVPQYCEVRVQTPSQTRTHFFFEDLLSLPQAITDWLKLYPLR